MIRQIEPWIDSGELNQLRRVVESTWVTEGPLTTEFEERMRALTGARYAMAYCNGTMAQFALLRAAGVQAGDEVIVPAMTFIATCNAVLLAGARPVLCDVRRDTMQLDPARAAELVGPRTRAVVPVHLYGNAVDIAELRAAVGDGVDIIEDAAQGVGVRRSARHVGHEGLGGFLSFYGNKTMTTGEGAIILTDDDRLAQACYRLKNHGRDVKGVFIHEHIGFNFAFTDLQAAVGLAQMDKLPKIIARKTAIRDRYRAALADVRGLVFQDYAPTVTPVPWFTNILVDDVLALTDSLAQKGIGTRRFFYPLHRQPCYSSGIVAGGNCSNADWLFEHGLSLPSSCTLTDDQVDRVALAVREHYEGAKR